MKNSCLRCGGQVGLEEGLCYRCNIFNRKTTFNNYSYFDEEIWWKCPSKNSNLYPIYPSTGLI